ncbi:aminotransferase class I/II-fold pyridoxal phosphate-dependent enzyme [Microbulbifer celer]|uniref:Aminotransferase class I/II-fold pyridoxal phosphate-dependent enzyme n=1 Tax=Microbulbifer celer TaxID=435905 RepID=A0ABW3UB14_9GAMM|nr:aminotransferase class V-fold PLP-dependent enzyme [Microbulbifer celer]UFN59119.1 aminotransferase class V-fold PLP-dependent enzyme [Microbulbifer celer]
MRNCDIVLVTDDAGFGARWVEQLTQALNSDRDSPLRLGFFQTDSTGLDEFLRRGSTQIVVLDEGSLESAQMAECYHRLKERRAEIDSVLLTTGKAPASDQVFDSILSRAEPNYGIVYRTLQRILLERTATPFADALKEYAYAARDSWHTPGHSSGDSLRDSPWLSDFYRFMGEHIFTADLSVSVKMLDSLMDPISVIRQSQQLAARTFGAAHSYFITNGTSTSNKIVLQHMLRQGERVIVDRNCHKSVHHAVIMTSAVPVYLESSVNQHYGVYGPVAKAAIFAAIDSNPNARMLVLTSCTYDGLRYDLKPIIDNAHSCGLYVLIDEAWYAHGRFHPHLRPTALECGADFVTQSTHKMLSAFSQASMIHVGTGVKDFDAAGFRQDINMHTSTSPQYGMIASLDVARKQMSIEGYEVLERTLAYAADIRDFVRDATPFRCLDAEDLCSAELADDGIQLDPTKVTVDVGCAGLSAPLAQQRLFIEFGIQVEKSTHNTLSFLVTIGTTESKVLRLKQALAKLSASRGPDAAGEGPLPALSDIRVLPRTAYFSRGEKLVLKREGASALVGRVACDEIVPFPPGVPLLVPGQEITSEILDATLTYVFGREGLEIHGLRRKGGEVALRVMTPAEESAGVLELRRTSAIESVLTDLNELSL